MVQLLQYGICEGYVNEFNFKLKFCLGGKSYSCDLMVILYIHIVESLKTHKINTDTRILYFYVFKNLLPSLNWPPFKNK